MRYLILMIVFVLCFTKYKNSINLFRFSMFSYAAFLALRCGQGLDYFSYSVGYNLAQYPIGEMIFEGARVTSVNYEVGYNILVGIFKQFGASYEVFIAILSTIMVILLYRFIVRYSENYMLSFFVLYASYGMIIIESALRQGIAMLLVVTLGIPLLEKKKYLKSCILILVAYSFHASSIAFSIILLMFYVDPIYQFIVRKRVEIILLVIVPVIILFNFIGIQFLIDILPLPEVLTSRVEVYLSDSYYSVAAIGYRIVMLIVVLVGMRISNQDKKTRKMLYLLITGYLLYFAVAQIPLLSRLTMYFEMLEIVLIPVLVVGKWKYKLYSTAAKTRAVGLITLGYMSIVTVLFFNDMNYNAQINKYSTGYVPYVTLFQKDKLDTIFLNDSETFGYYWKYYQSNKQKVSNID